MSPAGQTMTPADVTVAFPTRSARIEPMSPPGARREALTRTASELRVGVDQRKRELSDSGTTEPTWTTTLHGDVETRRHVAPDETPQEDAVVAADDAVGATVRGMTATPASNVATTTTRRTRLFTLQLSHRRRQNGLRRHKTVMKRRGRHRLARRVRLRLAAEVGAADPVV